MLNAPLDGVLTLKIWTGAAAEASPSHMAADQPETDICTPALEGVLGQRCLPWLSCRQLMELRAASRAMRDLVDGPTHEAWQEAATGLLRPTMRLLPVQTGLEWQAALRRELLSQRPLQTASLQHVHKVEACSDHDRASFWVAAAAPHFPCFLISRPKTGIIRPTSGAVLVLDPSQRAAEPKQLALKPFDQFRAFIPADGRLRIAELIGSDKWSMQFRRAYPLCWHTIDIATGQTLSSQQKHMWPRYWPHAIFHASGRVLGLVNDTTLAIMDAANLHELARCDISPCQLAHRTMWGEIGARLAWSESGSMLAIAGQVRGDGAHPVAEVHVYDTASGDRLQCIRMKALHVRLHWAPGSDTLAVHSWQGCGASGNAPGGVGVHNSSSSTGVGPAAAELRILRPPRMAVTMVGCTMAEYPHARWTEQLHWSPHGHLLVISWNSNNSTNQEGYSILDPTTLQHVATFAHDFDGVCWASGLTSSSRSPRLAAYFSGIGVHHLAFGLDGNGNWEYNACEASELPWPCSNGLSPNCSTLVGCQQPVERNSRAFHLSLDKCGSDGPVTPEWPLLEHSKAAWLQWAPLPARSAPQLYAFVHHEGPREEPEIRSDSDSEAEGPLVYQPPAAVSLVSSSRTAALGTWTLQHLSQLADPDGEWQTAAACNLAGDVSWAPNGRHLAVLCDKYTLVMTFGTTS